MTAPQFWLLLLMAAMAAGQMFRDGNIVLRANDDDVDIVVRLDDGTSDAVAKSTAELAG
jgi:hypothetical protein